MSRTPSLAPDFIGRARRGAPYRSSSTAGRAAGPSSRPPVSAPSAVPLPPRRFSDVSRGDSAIATDTSFVHSAIPAEASPDPSAVASLADLPPDRQRELTEHLSATGSFGAILSLLGSSTVLSPPSSAVVDPPATLSQGDGEEDAQIRADADLARSLSDEASAAPTSAEALAEANRDALCALESFEAEAAAARARDRDANRDERLAVEDVHRLERVAKETAAAAAAAAARLASSRERSATAERQARETRNANVIRVAVAKGAVRRTEEALRAARGSASTSPSTSPPRSPGPAYARVVADGRPSVAPSREPAAFPASGNTADLKEGVDGVFRGPDEFRRRVIVPAFRWGAPSRRTDDPVTKTIATEGRRSGRSLVSAVAPAAAASPHGIVDGPSGTSAVSKAVPPQPSSITVDRGCPGRHPGVTDNRGRGSSNRSAPRRSEEPSAGQRFALQCERERLGLDLELARVRLRHQERAVTSAWQRGVEDETASRDFVEAEKDFLRSRRALWEVEDLAARIQRRPSASSAYHDWELQRAAEAAATPPRRPSPAKKESRCHQRTSRRTRRKHRRHLLEKGYSDPLPSSSPSSSSSSSSSSSGSSEPPHSGSIGRVRESNSAKGVSTEPASKDSHRDGQAAEIAELRKRLAAMEGELKSSSSASGRADAGRPHRSASSRVPSVSARSAVPRASSAVSAVDRSTDSVSAKLLSFNPSKHFSVFKATLPLPSDHAWTALVTLMGRLQYVVRQTRLMCGDTDPDVWRPEWCNPIIRFLVSCVSSADVSVKEQTISKLLTVGADLASTIRKDNLKGPEGFAALVRLLTRKFTTFHPNSIPVMLAQYCVPVNTQLQDWIAQLKELVEGLRCFGDSCPSDSQIISTAIEGLNVQYPEIATFVCRRLGDVSTVDDMWTLFSDERLDDNLSAAKAPSHVTSNGPRVQSKAPRVHAIMQATPFPSLDIYNPAYELSSDEEGYQRVSRQVFSVVGHHSHKPFRFWKYNHNTPEGAQALHTLNISKDVCYNCGSKDHFLRDCPEKFLNACGMFCSSFGEGDDEAVQARWRAKLKNLKRQYKPAGQSPSDHHSQ